MPRRKTDIPDRRLKECFEGAKGAALVFFKNEMAVDEGFGLGVKGEDAKGVDGHKEVRPLDLGPQRKRDGQRRLVEKKIRQARAVKPILQLALAAPALLDTIKGLNGWGWFGAKAAHDFS